MKYHQIESLVLQSFTAHIAALFYIAMQCKEHMISLDRMKIMNEVSDVIAHLTSGQFIELVEDVHITAFTLDA